MPTVMMCKLPFATPKFNKNQNVWVVFTSGNQAFYVCGKFRGKGRYIKAWVSWGGKEKTCPCWKKIEVDDEFAIRHTLLTFAT